MDKEQDTKMNVDGSTEARTVLVELSSNTEKEHDEGSATCSSDILQIHPHVFIKEEPSEEGI